MLTKYRPKYMPHIAKKRPGGKVSGDTFEP